MCRNSNFYREKRIRIGTKLEEKRGMRKFQLNHLIIILVSVGMVFFIGWIDVMTQGELIILAMVLYLGFYNILCTESMLEEWKKRKDGKETA